MGRTVGRADTFEFQVRTLDLGIVHPTGYPLWLLLAKPFTWLPFGSPAWRVNLAAVAWGVLATGLLYGLLVALTGRRWPAALAALVWATRPTFWSQAIEAEVYTLHAVIVAGVLWQMVWLLGRPQLETGVVRRGPIPLAAWLGLGLTNHLTTVFLLPPAGYLKAAATICARHDVLLVADEIQTGLGRTGRFFACEHEGIRPDMVIIGKALSGGFYPVSAVLADQPILGLLKPGDHGSTFGGNPLAMRAGVETIRIMEEDKLLANAAAVGAHLKAALQAALGSLPGVKEVRGQGLMLGVELAKPCGVLVGQAAEAGLLISVTAESVIRIVPPLILTTAEADEI
ncbi:MAG: aminotransferase class III-fold pyridoxal phosphate-dependent enzyme, partial [Anaerolineales bacterium]|nr:aminotransferase class III-fold pyridoxal phosphate-dependent enzyme [Anaerolineales bacterium]